MQDKLKLILAGEPPYDIFVRWKPLEEQPIGWNPDLNDGVRLNIRPFMTAGILRKNPNIKWTKDRGKEPERDQEQFPWFWEDGSLRRRPGERRPPDERPETSRRGRKGQPSSRESDMGPLSRKELGMERSKPSASTRRPPRRGVH